MFSRQRFTLAILFLCSAMLACNISVENDPAATGGPAVDATKITLEIQGTAMAGVLTQQAADAAAQPVVEAATQAPAADTEVPPTAEPTAVDMQALIKNANILVYEDAGNSGTLVPWVKSTLDRMGLKYTYDGDALGNFMSHLNSGTAWDLIIVAGESRSGVQGEFWDVITPKATANKTALIVEMWYLSNTANGRIKALTGACGIEYQGTREFVDSIYTLDTASPIFTSPNTGFSLTNYAAYWTDKGGDYVRLTGSGDAVLVAGGRANETSRYGMITSCMEGRTIIQTFSSHDYKRETMQMLWENYITNTLTSHFQALP
jgi:hypothetical protein